MYEIDMSTLMLIGQENGTTKVITKSKDFIVSENAKRIVEHSCKYFGSSLDERVKATNRLVNMATKTPIIIEESRNIIFFPLKSVREKNNIWISFNNLDKYMKNGKDTIFKFKGKRTVLLKFSYYIVDNQVTRSMILDYELQKRKKSLEK